MSDKVQLIKEEIERLLKENEHHQHNDSIQESLDKASKCRLLYELKKFIESLPEEPASEDLKEEIENWMKRYVVGKDLHIINNDGADITPSDISQIAHHFAHWQKQKDQESIKLVEEPDLDKAAKEHAAELYGEGWMKNEHVQDNGFKAISNFKFGAE